MPDLPHDPVQETRDVQQRRSLCRFCAAMCGIVVEIEGDRVVKVLGDKDHPISRGYTCPKGRALGAFHHHPDRLDHPRIRSGGGHTRVGWDECLDDLSAKLAGLIANYGPSSIGIYLGTAGLLDGSTGVWRTLFAAIGSSSIYTTITVDAASLLLVQERISGHPMLMGQPDPDAQMTILIGMNPMVSHGQNFGMTAPKLQLRKWAEHGNLWVIDPRRSETAEVANHHLAIRPGSEYVLLGFLVREILREGADRRFLETATTGIEAIADLVQRFDLEAVRLATGLGAAEVLALLDAIRANGRIGIMNGTGVTMSGTANLTLLMIYALLAVTGSLDRPGGEWYNPGFVRNLDATGWPEFDYSGPGAPSRPDIPGRLGEYSAGVMVDEIEAGNLKALFVLGGNPIIALPETDRLRAALDQLDVLAVADVVETETIARATHILPSVGQLERADLPIIDFLSPHQFAQYTPAVVPTLAERKPIWWMMAKIAERLGHDILDGKSPEETVDDDLLRPLTANARATFDEIKAAPTGIGVAERPWDWVRRHLPGGRWRLAPPDILEQFNTLPQQPAGPGELALIPARQRLKLNSQMSDGLAAIRTPDLPTLGMNPDDARELGLANGDSALIESATGKLVAMVEIEQRIGRGSASFPHGFEKVNVGQLTSTKAIDTLSGMVTLGGIPITVKRIELEETLP